MSVLVIFVLLVTSVVAFAATSQTALVVRVYDGDTFLLKTDNGNKKVRLLGIDCPESYKNDKCNRDGMQGRNGCQWQIPHGKRAKKQAIKLLKDKTVGLECDGKCKSDHYGRLLRYVRLPNGNDIGLLLIKKGLCEDFSWKYPHPRQDRYREAQEAAKQKKKGIWK